MLRCSSSRLSLFTPSRFALCNAAAFGEKPFESKFARRSQVEAGAELAGAYAKRFTEHHKQKQAEGETEADIKREEEAAEIFQKGFKDSRTNAGYKSQVEDKNEQALEDLRRKLIYQSRYRGMAELDLVLGSFAQVALPDASPTQLLEYDAILRELDTDLFHWLITMPGRNQDIAAGLKVSSHKDATKASILGGTSDYGDADKGKKAGDKIEGSTPTVDDDFVEPKEMLEAEWHRRDELPDALKSNSMFTKLQDFCLNGRADIVKYR